MEHLKEGLSVFALEEGFDKNHDRRLPRVQLADGTLQHTVHHTRNLFSFYWQD